MPRTSQQLEAVPEPIPRETTEPETVTAVADAPADDMGATIKKAADMATALKVLAGVLVVFAGLVAASVKVLAEIPTRTESRADIAKAIKPIIDGQASHEKRIEAVERSDDQRRIDTEWLKAASKRQEDKMDRILEALPRRR